VPATSTDSNIFGDNSLTIIDGVLELVIPYTVKGISSEVVERWVTSELSGYGISYRNFTHIMYALPDSVRFGTVAAFAFIGWYLSVFRDKFASDLQALVHELGHNVGMQHSGIVGGSQLGDLSGMMGNDGFFNDDGPIMCFNGAKSWMFGWYADRQMTIDPMIPWRGNLVGIDDYLKGQTTQDEHYVVANIDNLYLMYNRQEGVNEGVTGNGDMVTVVEQATRYSQSWNLAALTEDTAEFRRDWGGKDLVIQVCERVYGTPDYAQVLVYRDDGPTPPSCNLPMPSPTPPPSSTTIESLKSCRYFRSRKTCTANKGGQNRCKWKRKGGKRRRKSKQRFRCVDRKSK